MNHLPARSSLRNPFMTPKQCNWLAPVISREGKVTGTLYCPKDVWAEYRIAMKVPAEIAEALEGLASLGKLMGIPNGKKKMTEHCGGYFCAAHFMRILVAEQQISRSPN